MQQGLVPDDSSPAEEQWSRKNASFAKASHRSPPSTGGQQDRGRSAGPGFPDLDGSGRTGGGPPPDHAGPQADVAGLPDPDAGPRPDAAGRGAGRRTTSPDPARIPADCRPRAEFWPGAGGAAYGIFGRGWGDSPFTTRRREGEGWRRVAGCRR